MAAVWTQEEVNTVQITHLEPKHVSQSLTRFTTVSG